MKKFISQDLNICGECEKEIQVGEVLYHNQDWDTVRCEDCYQHDYSCIRCNGNGCPVCDARYVN